MKFKIRKHSEKSRNKLINEDSYYIFKNKNLEDRVLAMVADGMGGLPEGDVASQMAVETISQELEPLLNATNIENFDDGELRKWIYNSFSKANEKLYYYELERKGINDRSKANESYQQERRPGTTLSLALMLNNKLYYANMGDSGIYALSKNNELEKLTEDDTFIQKSVNDGEFSKDEGYVHPFNNTLSKYLGQYEKLEGDNLVLVKDEPLDNIFMVLLGTDGWTDFVHHDELKHILTKYKTHYLEYGKEYDLQFVIEDIFDRARDPRKIRRLAEKFAEEHPEEIKKYAQVRELSIDEARTRYLEKFEESRDDITAVAIIPELIDIGETREYQLTQELEGVKNKLNEQKKVSDGSIQKNTLLEDQLEAYKSKTEEQEEEINNYSEQTSQLKEEKDSLQTKHDSLEKRCKSLEEGETPELSEEQKQKVIKDYKKSPTYTEEVGKIVKEKVDEAVKQTEKAISEKYDQELIEKGKEIADLRVERDTSLEEKYRVRQEKGKLNETNLQQESELKEKQNHISNLEQTVNQLESKLKKKEENEKRTKQSVYRTIKDGFKKKVVVGALVISVLAGGIGGYFWGNYNKGSEVQKAKAQYEQTIKQKDQRIGDLEEQLGELQLTIPKSEQRLSDKDKEVNKLKGKVKEYENKLAQKGIYKESGEYKLEVKGNIAEIAKKKGLWGIAEYLSVQGDQNIRGFIKGVSEFNKLKYNDTMSVVNGVLKHNVKDGIGPDIWSINDLDKGKLKLNQQIVEKYNVKLPD